MKRFVFSLCALLSVVAVAAEPTLQINTSETRLNGAAAWKINPLAKKEGMKVDGDLADWAGLPEQALPAIPSQIQIGDWKGDDDVSAILRAAWDEENLYLAITVRDDNHSPLSGSQMWMGDCVQLGFDSEGAYGPEYGFASISGKPVVFRWNDGQAVLGAEAVVLASRESAGSVVYEAALPWKAIYRSRPAGVFRMSLLVNDNDGKTRRGWIELTPGIGKSKEPGYFAYIALSGESAAPALLTLKIPSDLAALGKPATFEAAAFVTDPNIVREATLEVLDADRKVINVRKTQLPLQKGYNGLTVSWLPPAQSDPRTYTVRLRAGGLQVEKNVVVYTRPAFEAAVAKAEEEQKKLEETLRAAAGKALPLDFPKAALAIAKRFIGVAREKADVGLLRAALEDADYIARLCGEQTKIVGQAAAGEFLPPVIPQPRLDKITIKDGNFWAEGKPVMLVGAMGFGGLRKDIETYLDYGFNNINGDFYSDAAFNMLTGENKFKEGVVPGLMKWWEKFIGMNLTNSFNPTLHYFPFWAAQKYPDITGGDPVDRLPDWSGRGLHAGMRTKCYGGFFPFAIDSQNLRRLVSEYYARLMPTLAGAPGFCTVWLMNEPTYASTDPHYVGLFRTYLEKKYAGIAALNAIWGTAFKSFAEVEYPRQPGTPAKFDWLTFHQDQVAGWFEWLAAEAKKHYPNAVLSNKPMAWTVLNPELGIDFEREAELWEVPGCDAGRDPQSAEFSFDWQQPVLLFDLQKSIAPQKPLADHEYHYVHAPGITPAYVRATYFHSYLRGLRKSEFWYWETGTLDPEAVGGAGSQHTAWSQPRAAWGTSTAAMDLRRLSEYVGAFPGKPEAMLYFSRPSLYMDNAHSADQLKIAHLALNGLDAPVGIATDRMIRAGRLEGCKLLICPATSYIEPQTLEAVQRFVAAGGRVVLIGEALVRNQYGKPLSQALAGERVVALKESKAAQLVAPLEEQMAVAGVHRPVRALTAAGKAAWPVECRYAQVNGQHVVYLIGLNKESMKIRLQTELPVKGWRDLIGGTRGDKFEFIIEPLDVRMLVLE